MHGRETRLVLNLVVYWLVWFFIFHSFEIKIVKSSFIIGVKNWNLQIISMLLYEYLIFTTTVDTSLSVPISPFPTFLSSFPPFLFSLPSHIFPFSSPFRSNSPSLPFLLSSIFCPSSPFSPFPSPPPFSLSHHFSSFPNFSFFSPFVPSPSLCLFVIFPFPFPLPLPFSLFSPPSFSPYLISSSPYLRHFTFLFPQLPSISLFPSSCSCPLPLPLLFFTFSLFLL